VTPAVRWHTAIAVVLAAITLVANLADLLFLDFFGPFFAATWAVGTFAGVGLVVALRRPRHPLGWLFLVTGAGFALSFFVSAYSWRALVDAPGTLPAGEAALWLRLLWMPAIGSMLIAVMLFPSGRPLSRRWGITMAAMSAVFALALVSTAFAQVPISLPVPFTEGSGQGGVATIPNPFGVGGPPGEVLLALGPFSLGTIPAYFMLALVAVVLRFARSSGTERLQLKWIAYAASVAFVLVILGLGLPRGFIPDIGPLPALLTFGLIPVGAGIAILRYRLYDIDLLINRTLVYGATSAGLLGTYVVSVLALSTLLRPLTGSSDLAVAGSTLAVVALFGPLRRRIQDAVDRRFSRSRYDAQRTVDAFATRLRDQVDLDALSNELVDVVRDTVHPAHAGLWLREAKKAAVRGHG